MKLKNIFLTGLAMTALAACNDYLDVDTPSKYTPDYVFSSTTEADRALNGVYAQLLEGNTYGNAFTNSLILNSDVDFASNSSSSTGTNNPKRFDVTAESSTAKNVWNAVYQGVEYANEFIYNLNNSDSYTRDNLEDYLEYAQMEGEAKVIRAMFYDELCWYWGDVPFTMTPTPANDSFLPEVVSRDTIRMRLINDLKGAALNMKMSSELSDGVERISKEACWAMIARLALNAGGYSLRPDGTTYGKMERPSNYKEFYQIARAYADSVIQSGSHALSKDYRDVFIDECNYTVASGDDPIFEIPFAKDASGNIGYSQGPTATVSSDGVNTLHNWGICNGGVRTTSFYRYSFDESDARLAYLDGMFYYSALNVATIRNDYTVHNNKWSKLWNTGGTGSDTEGNTGINYPYLRYADVLLMFAEADNEINEGPTAEAKQALKTVRERAFRGAENSSEKVDAYVDALSTKADFLKAVLDERKWEFAGENMRWKDLVRNNIYNQELYWTFLRYYSVAEESGGSSDYIESVEKHDGVESERYTADMPHNIIYKAVTNAESRSADLSQYYPFGNFPNQTQDVVVIYNPYHAMDSEGHSITKPDGTWTEVAFYDWWTDAGYPKAQVLYSLMGFMVGDEMGQIYFINNGAQTEMVFNGTQNPTNLPVVRYILPYPQDAIERSSGAYTNSYGY